MSLFREFVGSIRVLQGSLRMPVLRFVIALFIVLGSSAVRLGRKLVVLSGFSVQVMHKNNVQREGLHQEEERLTRPNTTRL